MQSTMRARVAAPARCRSPALVGICLDGASPALNDSQCEFPVPAALEGLTKLFFS